MKQILLIITIIAFSQFAYSQTPGTPTGLTGVQVNLENKIKLDWVAPVAPKDTLTGYQISYNIKGSAVTKKIKVGKTLSTELTALTTDTVYNVTVQSYRAIVIPLTLVKDTLYSTPSSAINVIVARLAKPFISIDDLFLTHESLIVRIKDTNKYETGFNVIYEENGNITTYPVTKTGSDISQTLGSLKPNTNYKISVVPVRNGITGEVSNILYKTTKIGFPPRAVLIAQGNCPFAAKFIWTINERENEVREQVIQRSTDNVNFTEIANLPLYVKSYSDDNAYPGLKYFYRVFTRNETGVTFSQSISIEVRAFTGPSLPINIQSVQAAKTPTSLSLTWDHGTQDTECNTNLLANTEITMSVNGAAPVKLFDAPNWVKTYTVKNLAPGSKVEFFFRTVSDKGNFSDWTSIKDNTPGASDAPQNLIGVLAKDVFDNNVMYLSWDDVSNVNKEDYYKVYKSTDGINFFLFATILENNIKISDKNLKEGVEYYYKVRSGNWVGESEDSRIIGPFNIGYSKIPNAPYGVNLKKNGTGVDITWVDDSNNEKNFIVEKSVDGGATFGVIATLDRDITFYKDENITEGKTYFYKVKAINNIGASEYSKAEKITIVVQSSGSTFSYILYPNPIAEEVRIKAENLKVTKQYSLNVYDQSNRLIKSQKISFDENNEAKINTKLLTPGLYNLSISDGSEIISKKIVKL